MSKEYMLDTYINGHITASESRILSLKGTISECEEELDEVNKKLKFFLECKDIHGANIEKILFYFKKVMEELEAQGADTSTDTFQAFCECIGYRRDTNENEPKPELEQNDADTPPEAQTGT